jgi:hypothetical protein
MTLNWTLGRQVVRISSGWNWLRIESNYGLWIWQCSIFRSYHQRVSFNQFLFLYLYHKIVFLDQILEISRNIVKHRFPPNIMVPLLKLEYTCRIWDSLHSDEEFRLLGYNTMQPDESQQHFGATGCLHLQRWGVSQARNHVFWDVMLCSLVNGLQQFRGTCCLLKHTGTYPRSYTLSHPRRPQYPYSQMWESKIWTSDPLITFGPK